MTDTSIDTLVMKALGGYLKELYPDIKLFYMDQDWPKLEGPFFGLQVISTRPIGESDQEYRNPSNLQIHRQGHYVEVEVICFRGVSGDRPTSILRKVLGLIRDPELVHKHFTENDVGFLSFSNITKVDTVLDNVKREQRSLVNLNFHVMVEDLSPITSIHIEKVGINSVVHEGDLAINNQYELDFSDLF